MVAAGNVSAGCTAWNINQNVSSQRYSEIISSVFCTEKNQVGRLICCQGSFCFDTVCSVFTTGVIFAFVSDDMVLVTFLSDVQM